MTTRIWITRTRPAARRSAQAWANDGFDPVIAPLLTVVPVEAESRVAHDASLIFTSANSIRHCGIQGGGRRVYCVGDATAGAARAFGFSNVMSADGDWRDLVDIVDSTDKDVVHISGNIVRGAIVETLQARGIKARRVIVYRTVPEKKWPVDAERVGAVALYSPMASETLMALPSRDLSHMIAYCLSEAVAAPLRGLSVRIAAAPNERALIACSRAAEA